MPSQRNTAAGVALIASSLALVGAGLGASFTDAVSGDQNISTGTLCTSISSVDANGDPDGLVSPDGKSVTFELANQGSTFEALHTLTVTNCGTLPLNISRMDVHPSGPNDQPLADLVEATINGFVLSVTDAQNALWACLGCSLQPGQSLSFGFDFSASDLPNPAQGQGISPTISLDATELTEAARPPAGQVGPQPVDAGG